MEILVYPPGVGGTVCRLHPDIKFRKKQKLLTLFVDIQRKAKNKKQKIVEKNKKSEQEKQGFLL